MKITGLTSSLIAATLSSLCCITPVLALTTGASSIVATFRLLEPARPYLAGITIVILGLAWYQQLSPKKLSAECKCDKDNHRRSFLQAKSFLAIITIFALTILSFPYYAGAFYPKPQGKHENVRNTYIKKAEFKITGMTCQACEVHVMHEVNKLRGVVASNASYKSGNAVVEFDERSVNPDKIKDAINNTGYKVEKILP